MDESNPNSKETPFWKHGRFWLWLLILSFIICGTILSGPTQFPTGQNVPPGSP